MSEDGTAAVSEVPGSGVVITGAGDGIGAALARRFAAEGARVVVNDLDPAKATAVASEIGGIALSGDASGIVPAARDALDGRIDTFCANAGVGTEGGPQTPDAVWDTAWELNVKAHIRAARELLPDWLERGDGRFVATASAAGLLTMVGSAPYSVTKHAAVAFAEWLAITYGHRGLRVHAVCPQGVRTDMLRAAGHTGELVLAPTAIEPAAVADAVLEAIAADRFLVLPHPETAEQYALRAGDPDRWLTGMNALQQKVERSTGESR